jgi:hypothetical protein
MWKEMTRDDDDVDTDDWDVDEAHEDDAAK